MCCYEYVFVRLVETFKILQWISELIMICVMIYIYICCILAPERCVNCGAKLMLCSLINLTVLLMKIFDGIYINILSVIILRIKL